MRKRRRLANKMTIMVCAVLIAVSAFFYVPMEASAQESVNIPDDVLNDAFELSFNRTLYGIGSFVRPSFNLGYFEFASYLEDDVVYCVDLDTEVIFNTSFKGQFGVSTLHLGGINGDAIRSYDANGAGNPYNLSEFGDSVFYAKGSDLKKQLSFRTVYFCDGVSDSCTFNCSFSYVLNSISSLSENESDAYLQGYNAGYAAGEQVGESNGYSNGYSDGFDDGEQSGYNSGFQAGSDSVDTQSYYDSGYSAGYDAGYLAGYDEGYDAGYAKGLATLSDGGVWQTPVFIGSSKDVLLSESPFYGSTYGTIDRELYEGTDSVWFYNDVPGVYSNTTTFAYNLPIYSLNNNSSVRIDSNIFRFMFSLNNVNPYLTINAGDASLSHSMYSSKIKEAYVVYNGKRYYGQLNEGSYIHFDFIVETLGNPVYLDSKAMSLYLVVDNDVFLSSDTSEYQYVGVVYTPNLSFTLGNSSYAFYIRSFLQGDGFSESINDLKNELTDGYDSSQGNTVNSDLSSGLNEYQTAEDSLWATATTGLKDFTFFDFASVPAMVTGMSFIGSIMTSWFNQAGGASGVGIVLSILFSVMLVAMVLGLYRWYQSRGGKK